MMQKRAQTQAAPAIGHPETPAEDPVRGPASPNLGARRIFTGMMQRRAQQLPVEQEAPSPEAPGPVAANLAAVAPFRPALGPEAPPATAAPIEPGNINLSMRPAVANPDGTVSSVRSKSFGFDGREVLLPTVSDDGRIMSDQEAIFQYKATGKHLGIFPTPEAATAYAERLHQDQARGIDTNTGQPIQALRPPPAGAPGEIIPAVPPGTRLPIAPGPGGEAPPLEEQFMTSPVEAAKGVVRGAGIAVEALGGAAELGGFATRRPTMAVAGKVITKAGKAMQGGMWAPPEWLQKRVSDNPQMLIEPGFWAARAPELLGTMAPFMVSGAVGQAVAGVRGAVAFGSVAESLFEGMLAWRNAKDMGASDQDAALAAAKVTAINLPLTIVASELILGQAGKPIAAKAGRAAPLVERGLQALAEGGQEVAQDAAQAKAAEPFDPNAWKNQTDPLASFFLGSLGGVAAGEVVDRFLALGDKAGPDPFGGLIAHIEAAKSDKVRGALTNLLAALEARNGPPGVIDEVKIALARLSIAAEATAASGTVPETTETLSAQLDALLRGDKPMVLLPPGHPVPQLHDTLAMTETSEGAWVYPKSAPAGMLAPILESKKNGTPVPEDVKAKLLGYAAPKPAPGAPAVTVTGRTAAGAEAESQVVPPEKAGQAADQVGKVAGPGGTIEAGGEEQANKVIAERTAAPGAFDLELDDELLPHIDRIVGNLKFEKLSDSVLTFTTEEARDEAAGRLFDVVDEIAAKKASAPPATKAPAQQPAEQKPPGPAAAGGIAPNILQAGLDHAKTYKNPHKRNYGAAYVAWLASGRKGDSPARKNISKQSVMDVRGGIEAAMRKASEPGRLEKGERVIGADGREGVIDDILSMQAVWPPGAAVSREATVKWDDGTTSSVNVSKLKRQEAAPAQLFDDILEAQDAATAKVGATPRIFSPDGDILSKATAEQMTQARRWLVELRGTVTPEMFAGHGYDVMLASLDRAAAKTVPPSTAEGEKPSERPAEVPVEQPGIPDQGPLAKVPPADVGRAEGARPPGQVGVPGPGVDERRPGGTGERPGDETPGGVGGGEAGVGLPSSGEGRAGEPGVPGAEPRAPKLKEPDLRPGEANYRITDKDDIGAGGPKQKAKNNLDAIRLLKQIEAAGRPATPEEQAQLVKYVGWGGIPQPFNTWSTPREWEGVREELEGLLTDEEWSSANESTPNAHYTSVPVIRGIWDALKRLGIKEHSTIVEPSMGVGHFYGLIPEEIARHSMLGGVELDDISGRISKLLYPHADIHITGFENFRLPNNFVDLFIGNIPFGNYGVHDPAYKRTPILNRSIHNYFFAKALDKTRPGGIVAFITSSYTMDEKGSQIRTLLADRGDLIGAIRLPNTAFKGTAGTEVTADIIFLQKRQPQAAAGGEKWMAVEPLPGVKDIEVNEYYVKHPEMMLGKMARSGTMYAGGQQALEGTLTPEKLAEAVNRLPENIVTERGQAKGVQFTESEIPAAGTVKEGGYTVHEGKVVVRRGDVFEPLAVSQAVASRIKAILPVRDATREVFRTQLADAGDAVILDAREKLNKVYDSFVKRHGFLNAKENVKAFDGDPDSYLMLSLEKWDSKEKKATKTAIFEQRTIQKYKPVTSVDNAAEALSVSLNEKGRIDWPRMQDLTGLTPKEMQAELTGLIYRNPDGHGWETSEEYLSGNVRKKLQDAELAAKTEPAYKANVDALTRVQPKNLAPGEIRAPLGASWVPPEDVAAFLNHMLGTGRSIVRYADAIASWTVSASGALDSVANTQTWGTRRFPADSILEATLNGQVAKVWDRDSDGKRYINIEETVAAQAKQEAMKEEFMKWIWTDPERATRLAAKYNWEINNLVRRSFDGSHLASSNRTFPGSNPALPPRPHQANAVWRIIQHGRALLAHVVGSGKTLIMIWSGMEMKRLGLIQKPIYVVPNSMLPQFTGDFLKAYPAANLLVPKEGEMSEGRRQKFMSKIATGSFDGIIVTHEQFQALPVSDETFNSYLDEQLAELEAAIVAAEKESGKSSRIVKQLVKARKRLAAKIRTKANREEKDQTITFEELGIDQLFVDEAHKFKSLYVPTKRGDIPGIPTTESARAFDMFIKTQYLMKRNGNRGVVFATGTPLTNTIAEVYIMQRFLQSDYLQSIGMKHFDAWVGTFGKTVTEAEMQPQGGGFRMKERFSRFTNAPELSEAFQQVGDVQTQDMVKLDVPAVKGGQPEVIVIPPSQALIDLVKEFGKRADAIKRGGVDPRHDNMLKITTDGGKAALDMRLITHGAEEAGPTKLKEAAGKIYDIWKRTTPQRSTQLVFCDLGVPNARTKAGFTVYADLKAKLVAKGIPPAEIAFMTDPKNKQARQALFDSVNEGRVRVLIGHRETMGVGVNIQRKLIAAHHLDVPWRPDWVEQADGRIIRQGNENKEVEIYHYVTDKSFDSYRWGVVLRKARMVGQFMKADITTRDLDDISGTALTAAEAMALSSGRPEVIEKIKVDSEVRRLDSLRSHHDGLQVRIRREIPEEEGYLRVMQQHVRDIEADITTRDKAKAGDEAFRIEVGGKTYEGKDAREQAGKAVNAAAKKRLHEPELASVGKFLGFTIGARGFEKLDMVDVTLRGAANWSISQNEESPAGTVASMESVLRNLESQRDKATKGVSAKETKITELKAQIGKPFEHEQKLREAIAEQKRLEDMLDLGKTDTQAGALDTDTTQADDEEPETQNYSPMEDDYRHPEPGSGAADDIKGRYQIIRDLEEKINLPIRIGRMGPVRKITRAIYKGKPRVIRLRLAPDIAAAAHEIGHDIYRRIFKPGELRPYRDSLIALSQTQPDKNIREGFAELTRLYIEDPAGLDPHRDLREFFEKTLQDRAPEELDALKMARDDFARYDSAPATAQMIADIAFGLKIERERSFHNLYTDVVDRLHPVEVLTTAMNNGIPLAPEDSAYAAHQVLINWVGLAQGFLEDGVATFQDKLDITGEPLEKIYNDIGWGKDRKNFSAYTVARSAKERMEREKEGRPSPLLTPWDRERVDRVIAEQQSERFDDIFRRLRAFEDAVLEFVFDSMGMPEERREAIRNLNRDHVPFNRVMEVQGGRPYSIGRNVDLVNPIKKQKGSARQIVDPLETIVYNTFGMLQWAEQNAARLQLFDQAEGTPGVGDLVERLPTPMYPHNVSVEEVLKKAGLDPDLMNEAERTAVTIFRPSLWEPDPNVVHVVRDGDPVAYKVHPAVKLAITGANREMMPSFLKFLRPPVRLLKATATSTIGFMERNPAKDQFTAFTNTKYGFKPGVDWFRGIYHVLFGTRVYWDAKRSGALHSLLVSADRDYIQITARRMLEPHWKWAAKQWLNPLFIFQEISSVFEEATRVMEAKRALEKLGRGRKGAQAAGYAGEEITVPFQRIGARMGGLGSMAAFFTAGIGGWDKTVRQFKEKPLQTSVKVFATMTLPSILLWLLHKDEDWYKRKPRWERDLFWHITEHFKIPKPFLPAILFGSLVERMLDWEFKQDPHAFDQSLETLVGQIPSPAPTALLPWVENWVNYSLFYGRHIDKETGRPLPPEFRGGPYTSRAAEKLGQILHISPNKIENVVRGYTSSLGIDVLKLPEKVIPSEAGAPAERTWPEALFPGFVSRSPNFNAEPIETFYRGYVLSQEAAGLHAQMRSTGNTPAGEEYLKAHDIDLALAKSYERTADKMGKIRKEVRAVMADGSLSGPEKRKQLDALADELIGLAEDMNADADDARAEDKKIAK